MKAARKVKMLLMLTLKLPYHLSLTKTFCNSTETQLTQGQNSITKQLVIEN